MNDSAHNKQILQDIACLSLFCIALQIDAAPIDLTANDTGNNASAMEVAVTSPDADGDGIPDSIESLDDTDGDGIADYLDTDSDNDGIPDSVEGSVDSDGDSISDYLDADSDNDSIGDAFELHGDADSDGIADYLDLDSDNDGVYDIREIASVSISLLGVTALDANNDGRVDLSFAFGLNGMANEVERSPESGTRNEQTDSDNDGVFDFRDFDSDNDGILDSIEPQHKRDLDSDDDGLMDSIEVFGVAFDTDFNGEIDNFIDSNGDGVNDNLPLTTEPPADTDGDGKPDFLDRDTDGDGISDYFENWGYDVFEGGFIIQLGGNGVAPQVAGLEKVITDTDNDGIPDYKDQDSNNNGLSDIEETGGIDADGDGMADPIHRYDWMDPDSDAIPDILNYEDLPDTDGDGVPDFQQLLPGAALIDPVNAEGLNGASGNANPNAQTTPALAGANSGGGGSGGGGYIDPTLLTPGLLALIMLRLRRLSRKNNCSP